MSIPDRAERALHQTDSRSSVRTVGGGEGGGSGTRQSTNTSIMVQRPRMAKVIIFMAAVNASRVPLCHCYFVYVLVYIYIYIYIYTGGIFIIILFTPR